MRPPPKRKPLTWKEAGSLLLGLVPAAVITVLIARYAVNVPYQDNWDMYIAPWLRGDELKSCWPLFNGHRLILPCLIGHTVGRAFSMNALPWVFLKTPFFIAIYFVVYMIYRDKAASRRFYWMAVPFGLLIFTMAYWPMWIDPRPIVSQMAMLAFLIGIWVLSAAPIGWKAFAVAGLMAYISSLSFFSGNITWFVLGLALWLRGYRDRRYFFIWMAMMVTVLGPYVYDYLQPETLGSGAPIPNLIDPLLFALAFIGSPLTPLVDPGGSAILGLVGLTAAIGYSVRLLTRSKIGFERAYPWTMITLWVCVNAGFIALGRTGLTGLQGAFAPRYVSFGAVFWSAIVVLLVIHVADLDRNSISRGKRSRVSVELVVTVALFTLVTTRHLYTSLAFFQNDRLDDLSVRILTGRECLLQYETADDRCLELLYPHVDRLRRLMNQAVLGDPGFLKGSGSPLGDRKLFFLDPVKLTNVPHPIEDQITFDRAILVADQPGETNEQFRSMGDGYYQMLYQHPPSSLTWHLDLTNHAHVLLRSGAMVMSPGGLEEAVGDGVLFEISVRSEEHETSMFRQLILPSPLIEGFLPIEIDLSKYAGKSIDFVLSTRSGETEGSTPNQDWAYWHYPELILDRLGE